MKERGNGIEVDAAASPSSAKERMERLVIYAKGSDGDEWVMAGEETIVFACPRCGAVFTVERDGSVTLYSSLDALIRELVEEWNFLLADEGVTVVETRVEKWDAGEG
ncbi:MAG: hypothetical protein QXT28_08340 [Thermofilaceae archaeon]